MAEWLVGTIFRHSEGLDDRAEAVGDVSSLLLGKKRNCLVQGTVGC